MSRPAPLVHGLYAWLPAFGYGYIHPANRRSFELLEPVGKVFEKISAATTAADAADAAADWLTLRYDEQQFLVRPDLFKELYQKPAFSFGDLVEEAPAPAGQPAHRGLISDVYWDERRATATFQLVERKRKVSRVFEVHELRLVE